MGYNMHHVLLCGIHYYGTPPESWDVDLMRGMDIRIIVRYVNHFERVLEIVPDLQGIFDDLVNCVVAARHIANFMERHTKQARSDDSGNIKNNILRFIAPKPDFPALRFDLRKIDRGFHHLVIGRLLCPVALLGHFDRGPQHFCDEAISGRVKMTAEDLPAYLYPDDAYNDQAPDELLLQSPLIASCYRSVITGPGSGLSPDNAADAIVDSKALTNNRRSIAKAYNISECTSETIVYICMLCRFALDATHEWKIADGDFKYHEFYDSLLELFEDEDFAAETIKWYNVEVFGGGHRDESGRLAAGTSTMDLIAAKRRERQKAKVIETRPTQTPINPEVTVTLDAHPSNARQAGSNEVTPVAGPSNVSDSEAASVSQQASIPAAASEKNTVDGRERAEATSEEPSSAN